MLRLPTLFSPKPLIFRLLAAAEVRFAHRRAAKPAPPIPPPTPPRPPQKPVPFTVHGVTWHDPFSWMSNLSDNVAMRHMDVYIEQEEKYTEAVLATTGADRLQRKLQIEMAPRMASDLCTPPVRWGPWLYYRRMEEGKQYPVLCRRLARLHEEFISYSEPSAGFDYTTGKRIEQKLLDYNQEAERFGGYSHEELSEVSPDHHFLAYTMYDKDKDCFTLSVRDLTTGSLCDKPRADRVANLSWAMNGKALLYTVTDNEKRPYRIFCSILGSGKDDILILEEPDKDAYVNIRNTKDFQFVTVNTFSTTYSKVYLINAADPFSGMTLVWESEPHVHCAIEHHRGYIYLLTNAARGGVAVDSHYLLRRIAEASGSNNWESILLEDPGATIEDVDFCDTHMVLILKEGKTFRLCSIPLPLPVDFKEPVHLAALRPSYLALPKHVCQISPGPNYDYYSSTMRFISRKHKQEGNPGLLHGHGAYGELLDKRWRSELKSLLDRGWIIAYADVRGGGGGGKKWHHDGRRTKKQNSINDFVSCAEFLVNQGIVKENSLAAWGYSAGGLLVASAINTRPDLFRAAVLKVPFLDVCNTLLYPILPLTPVDYEEFGYPVELEDFLAIKKYSPYDNIQKDALYPSVLVTSSFITRFGFWEAAKWVAKVRDHTIYDPQRPILLNLTTDVVEENKYLESKELALETAFLIKMGTDS
ncbi:uncharacterized protein [Elaeis guineensis]|uniref:Prolyl endopeptidase n=1 Tax=Elaeis guineensis var. tenera TaxID=51953 RepID=A0A6J0PSM8_ELAGV|nr:uncharacterized protein LOC105060018 isoform X2 [Elaeis guineensis]